MALKTSGHNRGITLMELLVAIPMLAIVAMSVTYALASSSRLTATQIARVKCQVAAGNLLTLIKAKTASKIPALTTFAEHVNSGILKTSSVAHPDGGLLLRATAESLDNTDGAHGTISPVFRIRVEAPAFDVRAEIKTYFSN
ncbi:MAG: hypothetical protein EOM80_09765 [Erysipelotrichia bacterium]|nr:hypothetical protein [Erysipelotrichia bacterium]